MLSLSRAAPFRVVALCLAVSLSGCLDRKEQLTVHADGAIDVRHEISGDPGDFEGPARLPSSGLFAGRQFAVRQFDRKRGADVEHVLVATARFRNASELPTTFAEDSDPLRASSLAFTTDVRIRRDGDRTHYLFVRRYHGRPKARFDFHERRAIPESVRKRYEGKKDTELTPEDRRIVLTAMADFERRKAHEWIEMALEGTALAETARLEAWLAARGAIDAYCKANFHVERLEAILALPKRMQKAEEHSIHKAMKDAALRAIADALGAAAPPRRELAYRLALAHESFDVTDDLDDENFTLRVQLPGTLVADNGAERTGNTVEWKFSGKDLHDQDVVLVARSVVVNTDKNR